ncbi:MAG: PKD domain-containing protein [Bacteroidota bacterium]
MKKLLFLILFSLHYYCSGQGNMITITSVVPSQLTICGTGKLFTITIYNPSPFTITNDTLKVSMPNGINYLAGSVSGATYVTQLFPNVEVFALPTILPLQSITITYIAEAKCNVLAYISGGGITKNNIRVDYRANNTTNYNTHITSSYLVKQPYLVITTITNQSYTGNIGDVFSRCITIVNAGSGELSEFSLTDIHGSGIQVNSVNKGTLTNVTTALAKVIVNGVDFATIGDGDNLFENGESMVICETVTILNCISASSAFKAFWGCSVNACQSSVSSANIVFPNYIPNLVMTPTASMNTCIGAGNASPQQLRIVNTGLGNALNVALEIFQATGGGYNNTVGSNIDAGSFTMQVGSGGTPAFLPTTIFPTSALNCMTAPIGKVTLTIPTINAGDTVFLKWNSYSCCYNACSNVGQRYINGWRYRGTYKNICQNTYVIYENWGRVYSNIYGALVNNGSPSTLNDGQTGTFNFLFSNYGNSYPAGPGVHWKFEFTVPNCFSYSGNLKILRSNGINTWLPTSVNTTGNVITAIFNGTPPWSLAQGELKLDLTLDCSSCTGTDSLGSISVKSFFVPNSTCACEIGVSCQSTAISINCPNPCPEGLIFTYFDLTRTNYGYPDNEPSGGNGIPDGLGPVDMTKVKTARAMFGDTIKGSFNGWIKTSIAYPSWKYCYAISSITNGNRLAFVDATLKIYRAGALFATCTNFTPVVTDTSTKRTFKYNLSDSLLGSCFTGPYLNNDSLVFEPRYRVISNIRNSAPLNCYSSNEFYLSDLAAFPIPPTPVAHKFQCGTYNGSCSIIGYWFRNWESESYDTKSCNNVVLTQDYHLSIGPGNNNDAGGNLFPYEYRNWAHVENLTAIVPPGYTLISARFREVRTAGTLVTNASSWINLTPANPGSDTLSFPVGHYYINFGGSIITPSDDGFYGTLEITLQPGCEVTPSIYQGVQNDVDFAVIPQLTGPGTDTTFLTEIDDYVVYDPPDLFIQSTLPSVFALNTTTTWDISISNTSNVSDALNTWISGPVISGVSIVRVVDLDNSVIIPLTGSVYQVGTVNATTTRNFRITGSYISCSVDSIIAYVGWNCFDGYPASVDVYPCTPEKITLTLTPLTPAFSVNSAGPASIELCDTADFIAVGTNIQLGTGYNIIFRATLPTGSAFVPGSSQLSYPVINPYLFIPDPTIVGNTLEWNISNSNSQIDTAGLKGLLEDTLSSFKIKFKVNILPDCSYLSGSTIFFVLLGEAACGLATELDVSISPDLDIVGATVPYTTAIVLKTTYVSPCAENSTMRVVVHNQGPTAFGNSDSVRIKLPVGVTFTSGSFSGIHNAPVNGTPLQYTLGGNGYLLWKLPVGVASGDSTIFTFDYTGDPLVLPCGIVFFEANTYTVSIVTCSGSGLSCITTINTGDTTLAVFTYKAYLVLANGSATSIPNPPAEETVTLNFDIVNTGQAILTNADSIIQFYYDANGNGFYDPADVFLTQDTVLVPKDSTMPYSITFDVPAGQACAIIAIVDPTVNPCVCSPSQLLLEPPLKSLNDDSTLCSGESVLFGTAPVTGYTYGWNPSTGLSSATIANPLLTTSNLSTAPVSTMYVLTTNRIGCIVNDTITITVNPIPVSNAGADIDICPNDMEQIGTLSVSGYTYLWSPSNGLSDTSLSDPTVTLVNPGTTTYKVITEALGCFSSDSLVVTVNPIPVSNAGTDILTCLNLVPGTIGTASTTGYAYLWSPATGLSDITASNPTVVLTNPGSITYTVTTTALACFSSDTVEVTVNPIPTATITGTTAVCHNGTAQRVTFKGAGGTPPYIFTYKLNGGADQTINSAVGDSIVILASATVVGTFSYTLISVQDSSSTACSQAQSGIAVVTVNPLPTAAITGTIIVCQGLAAPNVTFTGANSTAPYTFTYTINGGANQIITTTSGNSIDIAVSTDTPGTFIYALISVQDASSTTCSQVQPDTATVLVNSLPVANFGSEDICLNRDMLFTDSSSVSSGTVDAWLWIYGDNGVSGIIQNPVYLYTNAGTYSVSLISTTNNGCKDTTTQNVVVHPLPNVQFNTMPVSIGVCDGTSVQFNDASSIATPDVLQSWSWNFGDASLADINQNTSHLYAAANPYTVQLHVISNFGCVDSIAKPITINPNPVVNFTGNPIIGCEPLCISFKDSSFISNGSNIFYTWDLGDGSPVSNSQIFEHCYVNDSVTAASFNISLTVTSDSGCVGTLSKNSYITVHPNPMADFSVDPQKTTVTDPVFSLVDLSTGTDIWNWNFGDNTSSGLSNPPPHRYPGDTGTYVITLITSSQYGCADTTYKTVIVEGDFVFYIPNAFTPNGDGINDYFFGTGIGIIEYDLWIFDRWGNMIFHGDEIPAENSKWNGRVNSGKEEAQIDVYVWKVTLKDMFGNGHKYIGTVTLVK